VASIAAAVLLFNRSDTAAQTAPAPVNTSSAPAPASPKAKAPISVDGEPVVPSEEAVERASRLMGEARRLADDGKFDEAIAKLDAADKAAPGLSETADMRRKIAEMRTPEGQFATQIGRARFAIDTDDPAAAEKALGEAERLKPQAPEIAQLRQQLQAAQQKEAKRSGRVANQLTAMREAIAHKDIVAADRAFNEASRIDIHDPALDQARIELARAHDAERGRQVDK
jgi:tetratricopeptide (TPR) repeat protein